MQFAKQPAGHPFPRSSILLNSHTFAGTGPYGCAFSRGSIRLNSHMFAGTGPYGCAFPCGSILPGRYMIIKKITSPANVMFAGFFILRCRAGTRHTFTGTDSCRKSRAAPVPPCIFCATAEAVYAETIVLCSAIFGTL